MALSRFLVAPWLWLWSKTKRGGEGTRALPLDPSGVPTVVLRNKDSVLSTEHSGSLVSLNIHANTVQSFSTIFVYHPQPSVQTPTSYVRIPVDTNEQNERDFTCCTDLSPSLRLVFRLNSVFSFALALLSQVIKSSIHKVHMQVPQLGACRERAGCVLLFSNTWHQIYGL